MRRLVSSLAVIAVIASATAAATLSLPVAVARADGEVQAAQGVIANQIDAFLADDMNRAYSFAAPGIKAMYPNPEVFFDMVKRGYAPVYRPGNFAFGRGETSDGGAQVVQEVLIAAPDGENWTALYVLDRQPDGSFKISSVQMVKSNIPQT